MNKAFLILLLLIGVNIPLRASPEPFASEGITTYSEAKKWVAKSYKGETIKPNSSLIYKITYFPKGRFMIVYFQSKKSQGYLYHRVTNSLWKAFKKAPSKGKFYHREIKGNKAIYLELDKG